MARTCEFCQHEFEKIGQEVSWRGVLHWFCAVGCLHAWFDKVTAAERAEAEATAGPPKPRAVKRRTRLPV